jgi:DNA polymerase eta
MVCIFRIIAVNYEAKAEGVKRGMMGDDARSKCPSVHLFRVPESRGKADLTRY